MDVLKEQAQLGPSLGKESHRLDAMTETLGARQRLDISFGGNLSQRLTFGGLTSLLGLGFGGSYDYLMDAWHLVMRRIPWTMENTLVPKGNNLGGPTTSFYFSTTC
jgi:hypothetical protein